MKTITIKKNYTQNDDLGYLLNETKVEALKQALKLVMDNEEVRITQELGNNSFIIKAVVVQL